MDLINRLSFSRGASCSSMSKARCAHHPVPRADWTGQLWTQHHRSHRRPIIVNAKVQREAERKHAKLAETSRKGKDKAQAEEVTWGITDLSRYSNAPAWDVPWGWPTTLGGMVAWATSFLLVGLLSVPLAMQVFDFQSLDRLTALQESELALLDQIVSTFVGIAIVWSIGARAGPDRPPDYLVATLENPFRKPDGWLLWSLVGMACAPFAIIVSSLFVSLLPVEGGRGTVDGVAHMMSATVDTAVFTNLLFVTGVLAPILEETVFRGFLLTSLTKHMAPAAAVTVSSAAFAACHLSLRDFPQLMALGMVMGFMYLRSRNLLTSILIHGAWNSGVLVILFTLIGNGVSISDIIGN